MSKAMLLTVPLASLLAASLVPARSLSAASGRAEPPQASPSVAAPERAVVELVLIEAYVTDSRGRPVAGLEGRDFVLVIDGHVKPIASVEHREAIPAGTAPGPAHPAEQTGSTPTAPAGPARGRRFVLFFEDGSSEPQGLTAARDAAEKLLSERFAPDDQIALAAYDRSLRILHDFTTDRDSLRKAIQQSRGTARISTFAREVQGHQEDLQRLASHEANDMALRQAALAVANYASLEQVVLRGILNAVRTLVESLAGWPGYKAILFLGDGVPDNPARLYLDQLPLLAANPDEVARIERYDLSPEIKELTYAAAAAGVTIHTVQTSGLSAGRPSEMRAASRRSNSLETIALNTGGLSSSSNDLLKALAEAEESGRSYYILGYTPEGAPDGRYHTVQVRVKKSGARVRWRRGFTRLLPEQARERAIQAAYVLPEFHADMGIDLSAVAGPAGASGRVTDLVLHIPPNRTLFLPRDGRATARLEVGVVALDDSGRETLRVARQVEIALGPDAGSSGVLGLNFFCRVRLPSSAQSVTAVVDDLAAGQVGAARLPLPAAPTGESAILGLSIYSLQEQSAWVQIDPAAQPGEGAELRATYTVGPALKRTFAPGERAACGFKVPSGGFVEQASLKLVILRSGQVLKSQDVAAPGGNGHDAAKTLVSLEGLPVGDYDLVIREVGRGQILDRGAVPFSIR